LQDEEQIGGGRAGSARGRFAFWGGQRVRAKKVNAKGSERECGIIAVQGVGFGFVRDQGVGCVFGSRRSTRREVNGSARSVQVEEEMREPGERVRLSAGYIWVLGWAGQEGRGEGECGIVAVQGKSGSASFGIKGSAADSGQEGQREGKWELNGYIIITGISAQGVRA
jgi:hypothetical protein